MLASNENSSARGVQYQEQLDYNCFIQLLSLIFCMVYWCTEPPLLRDLNNIQNFLDRCYKRRYISRKLNIREFLERSDCRIFRKAMRTNSTLVKILPERNFTNYALRKPGFYHPIMATERFKSSYVNGLIF